MLLVWAGCGDFPSALEQTEFEDFLDSTQGGDAQTDAGDTGDPDFHPMLCSSEPGCSPITELDFGMVAVGTAVTRTIRVDTAGQDPGELANIKADPAFLKVAVYQGPPESLIPANFPVAVTAGKAATVEVTLNAGVAPGELTVNPLRFELSSGPDLILTVTGTIVGCSAPEANCNDSWEDGCEASLEAPETCGSCTNECQAVGGTPICEAGLCSVDCPGSLSTAALSDDFSHAELVGWKATDPEGGVPGSWATQDGGLVQSAATAGAYLWRGDPAWTDYTLSATLTVPTGATGALMVRYVTADERFYALQLDGDGMLSVVESIKGTASSHFGPEKQASANGVALELRVAGGVLTARIGDTPIGPITDQAQTIDAGAVGLWAAGAGVRFEDVKVTLSTTCVGHCETIDCANGGVCMPGTSTATCDCPDSWEGATCGTKLDPCEPNPCGPKEVCEATPGGFECPCALGFEEEEAGTGCKDVDECDDEPTLCNGLGEECKNTQGSYECGCQPGYQKDGEVCVAGSGPTPCEAEGTCTQEDCPGTTGCACVLSPKSKWECITQCTKDDDCPTGGPVLTCDNTDKGICVPG